MILKSKDTYLDISRFDIIVLEYDNIEEMIGEFLACYSDDRRIITYDPEIIEQFKLLTKYELNI